jgi:23S rRNA pseudouridine2605 synthase
LGVEKKGSYVYEVVVKEGVKREVRKMVAALGGKVLRLLRIKFGPLELGNLRPGEIRELTQKEKKKLFEFAKKAQEKISSSL